MMTIDLVLILPWVVIAFLLVERTVTAYRQMTLINSILLRDRAAVPSVTPRPPSAPVKPSSEPGWLAQLEEALKTFDLTPAKPKPAAPPAKISGPFADFPPWFILAAREIGTREEGDNAGAAIERYISLAHAGSIGEPWCAIFANACLELSGVGGTRSPSSQSFRNHPDFVKLDGPAKGAIAVFWRGSSPADGIGHVGFYMGEIGDQIWTLGGNENDMVQIEALPRSSASFGLVGYWWPRKVAMPPIGVVKLAAGTPVHITKTPASLIGAGVPALTNATPAIAGQVAAVQANITATMFGGEQSAYGGAINDSAPGCALPSRFHGDRPLVQVTNRANGKSVICRIVDVGPWNINDPYWQQGRRPQAESGADLGQTTGGTARRTNGAGIDLTFAAAAAIGIDGKGRVDWQFVTASANSNGPHVT